MKDVVTLIAIVGGGILTYYKFFKGRTFSAKADINIEVTLIETPNDSYLHTVKFSIINNGNVTIWNPTAKIGIKKFGPTIDIEKEVIEGVIEKSFFDNEVTPRYYMVDPGEKTFFVQQFELEKKFWGVSYDIEVVSRKGDTWKNSVTVANKLEC